jgi:hypothetical protein
MNWCSPQVDTAWRSVPEPARCPGGDGPIHAFAAEPGDTTSVTLERSWLSWPTPLETTFMTGKAPVLAAPSLLSPILKEGLGRAPRHA